MTSGSLAGAEMMTLRAPASRWRRGVGARAEAPARLDDDLRPELAPRQRARVGLGEDRDLDAVDADRAVQGLDGPGEAPVDRVVREQLRDGGDAHHVVDRDPLDVGALLDARRGMWRARCGRSR